MIVYSKSKYFLSFALLVTFSEINFISSEKGGMYYKAFKFASKVMNNNKFNDSSKDEEDELMDDCSDNVKEEKLMCNYDPKNNMNLWDWQLQEYKTPVTKKENINNEEDDMDQIFDESIFLIEKSESQDSQENEKMEDTTEKSSIVNFNDFSTPKKEKNFSIFSLQESKQEKQKQTPNKLNINAAPFTPKEKLIGQKSRKMIKKKKILH